jgi:N-acetylglucosamine repressor
LPDPTVPWADIFIDSVEKGVYCVQKVTTSVRLSWRRSIRARRNMARDPDKRGKADLRGVRNWNTRLVLSTVRAAGKISRYDVAKKTGLNPTTVTKLTQGLVGGGFLCEAGKGESSGGRRPDLVAVDGSRHFFLTIHVGLDAVRVAVVDFCYRPVAVHTIAIPEPISGEHFARLLGAGLGIVDGRPLLGVGVGVGGVVDGGRGVIAYSACFRDRDLPIATMVQEHFDVPVLVENDLRIAAWQEYAHRPGTRALAVFYAGEGVGSGVVVDGRLFRGATGFSGEIGHTIVADEKGVCTLGHKGCLEALTNTRAFEDALGAATGTDVSIGDIDRLYAEDDVCRDIVDVKTVLMSTALAFLVDALDLDVLLLNGPLFQASEAIFTAVREQVLTRSFAGRMGTGLEVTRHSDSPKDQGRALPALLWHELLEQDQLATIGRTGAEPRRPE